MVLPICVGPLLFAIVGDGEYAISRAVEGVASKNPILASIRRRDEPRRE